MKTRLATAIILMLLISQPIQAAPSPVIEQIQSRIEQDMEQYVAAQAAGFGRRVEFTISRMDPRLNMPVCTSPLTTDFDRSSLQSRVSVKVICQGAQPWSIYVPLQIQAWQPAVTAVGSLARGQKITKSDVILTEVEVSGLRYGFFDRLEDVIGLQVKRNFNQGEALYPGMLERPLVVEKGDEVMILARGSAIAVQVQGTALADGKIGEQINVRNLSSQRVIRATVVEEGVVEVQI